jgi:plasmid stability protein
MHNACMPRLIQIRNVPDDVHERLKARAAAQGESLNTYMRRMVVHEAEERPTIDEVLARIAAQGPLGEPDARDAADYIREAREERDAQLMAATSQPRRGRR